MKKFTNTYMLLYALGLAAVVAVVLTVVSVGLHARQERNRLAEKQMMILKTIGIEADMDNTSELFAQNVNELKADDETYYSYNGGIILPMRGNGLWGPIWGYIALDGNATVAGAVFDHEGETPGLGAEIATDAFAARFIGKRMDSQPIRLMKKADKDNPYEVDAISGGTMTSNGVTAMLEACYNKYIKQ